MDCPIASDGHGDAPVDRLLGEFESMLEWIPPDAYDAAPATGGSSVARHVSHSLGLIESLVSAGPSRVVVYGPTGQAAPGVPETRQRIRELRAALARWPSHSLDAAIRVDHLSWHPGCVERAGSTLRHELAFVVNHVVDRQKIIERLLISFGSGVPEGFGSMALPPLRVRASIAP